MDGEGDSPGTKLLSEEVGLSIRIATPGWTHERCLYDSGCTGNWGSLGLPTLEALAVQIGTRVLFAAAGAMSRPGNWSRPPDCH